MLSKFIFVVGIISNDGDLQMRAYDMDVCPEVQTFGEEMQKMKNDGQFINWEAVCIGRDQQTEKINYE